MYSDADTLKGWVAPFGHLGINACSRLPLDFRSVPRPSSPPGAKASTRCPSLTQSAADIAKQCRDLAQDPANQWPVAKGQWPGDQAAPAYTHTLLHPRTRQN